MFFHREKELKEIGTYAENYLKDNKKNSNIWQKKSWQNHFN